MENILPIALGFACMVFIATGLRILLDPKARAKYYIPAKAKVIQYLKTGNSDHTPLVEFQTDGKTVRSQFRTAVPGPVHYDVGDEMDILYCRSRILFISSYLVVLDDHGRSMRRSICFYRAFGILFIVVGLLLLISIALLLQ